MTSAVDFTRTVGEWLVVPTPVLGALIVVALLAWLCWRARSTHPLLMRAWRLLMGRCGTADREVGKLIEARDRLIRFRFFFGLPVRTLAQAKRVGRWACQQDEDLSSVAACGNLFDLEACRLREDALPTRATQGGRAFFVAVFAVSVAALLVATATDRALLQFEHSGVWFSLSADSAVALRGDVRLDAAQCVDSDPALKLTTFSDSERTSLCKAFGSASTAAFVKATVSQQRFAFAPLAASLTVFGLSAWTSLRRGVAGREMQRRLEKRGGGKRLRQERRNADVPAAAA
jgi:hypothetical protein